MSITPKKPATADDFLKGAKADGGTNTKRFVRDKVFPVRLPAEMHDLLKNKAGGLKLSLHEFILKTLEKEIT
jgi:predicted HicB family RNase H-like nuclease